MMTMSNIYIKTILHYIFPFLSCPDNTSLGPRPHETQILSSILTSSILFQAAQITVLLSVSYSQNQFLSDGNSYYYFSVILIVTLTYLFFFTVNFIFISEFCQRLITIFNKNMLLLKIIFLVMKDVFGLRKKKHVKRKL
jgi:hypothetical protein